MTRNASTSPRLLVAVLTMGLLTAMASLVSAQECSTDADCSEGFHCELYGAETCVVAPGQEDPDCGEPVEFGECVRSPITCTTDADCPTYLSCIGGGGEGDVPVGFACEADSEGNCIEREAPEPVEPAQSFCAYREITCEANADCPADFECITYEASNQVDCAAPAIACDPADPNCELEVPDCDPGEVEFSTAGICQPREIACEADADCPTDWRCITETWGYCGGSEGEGDIAVDSDAAPGETGTEGAPAECYEESVSRCLPASLADYGYGSLSAASGAPTQERNDDNDGDIFAGGNDEDSTRTSSCSTVSLAPTAGGLPIAALLILGLALLPMRRR